MKVFFLFFLSSLVLPSRPIAALRPFAGEWLGFRLQNHAFCFRAVGLGGLLLISSPLCVCVFVSVCGIFPAVSTPSGRLGQEGRCKREVTVPVAVGCLRQGHLHGEPLSWPLFRFGSFFSRSRGLCIEGARLLASAHKHKR